MAPEREECIRVLVGKPEEIRRRWKYNIKNGY